MRHQCKQTLGGLRPGNWEATSKQLFALALHLRPQVGNASEKLEIKEAEIKDKKLLSQTPRTLKEIYSLL